jgi:hypothetical protein
VCSGGVCGAECLQTELNIVIFEPYEVQGNKMPFDLKKIGQLMWHSVSVHG